MSDPVKVVDVTIDISEILAAADGDATGTMCLDYKVASGSYTSASSDDFSIDDNILTWSVYDTELTAEGIVDIMLTYERSGETDIVAYTKFVVYEISDAMQVFLPTGDLIATLARPKTVEERVADLESGKLDKPTNDPGTDGQVLYTGGDGTTEWDDLPTGGDTTV